MTRQILDGSSLGPDGSHCASGILYSKDQALREAEEAILVFSTSTKYLKKAPEKIKQVLKKTKLSSKNLEAFANAIASVYCDDAGYFAISPLPEIVDSRFDFLVGLIASHGQDVGGPPLILIVARKGADFYILRKGLQDVVKNAKCALDCRETDPDCKSRDQCYANYFSQDDIQKTVQRYVRDFLEQVELEN